MALNIEDLFSQADEIIDARGGQEKTASVQPAHEDDEITKLANQLIAEDSATNTIDMQPKVDKGHDAETILEKVAMSLAVTEVLINLNEFKKIAELEKVAQSKGIHQDIIDKFVSEKVANIKAEGIKGIAKALTLPGAILGAGGAAGAAGYVHGKKKGKAKGYDQALQDVNQAFSNYARN